MRQMSLMYWLVLMFYFILMFILMLMFIYFMFLKKPKYYSDLSMNSMNWLW